MGNQNSVKIKAAYISLFFGLGIFCAKIFAYMITDSAAIFSDAAESVVHILATGFMVYSIHLSNKPPDESHFYGHGNIEYFSAGFEGLLIIVAAITIIYTSVESLIAGAQPENLDSGTMIIAAVGLINLFVGYYLVKQGKKTNSVALVADGKHVLTDSVTSIGVVIGLIFILITDIPELDPIIAIIVALNIVYTGTKLIRNSFGELMNETDESLLLEISNKLNEIKRPYWIDLHHLRFWKSADRIFIDFHLTLPFYFTIKQSHEEEEYICKHFKETLNQCEIRIHTDFCNKELCKFCKVFNCNFRYEENKISVDWSIEKLLGDPLNSKTHIS